MQEPGQSVILEILTWSLRLMGMQAPVHLLFPRQNQFLHPHQHLLVEVLA